MIVQIDKQLSEITIDNYKKMQEVLEESQGFMQMTEIVDLNKIEMNDFEGSEPKAHGLDDKKKQIIEDLKSKISDQCATEQDKHQARFEKAFSDEEVGALKDYLEKYVSVKDSEEDIAFRQDQLNSMSSLYRKVSRLHRRIIESITQREPTHVVNFRE